jgi:hypothetical protein
MNNSEKIVKLKELIKKHKIRCVEDVWQRDSIGDDAPEIIQEMCEIVGYYNE